MKSIMKSTVKQKFSVVVIALVVALMLSFFFGSDKKKPGEGFFHSLTAPFAGFFSGAGFWFQDKAEFVSSIGDLKIENERLNEENIKLEAQVADLKDIKKENEELRKQIELAPRQKYELESSMVIGHDVSGKAEFLYIDKGSRDGVENGMAVIVGEGVLVGKISSVYSGVSHVEILLSPNSKINGEIVESGGKGIVNGRYGTSIIMDMIPQTVEINKGDSVITSGIGGVLPRGLLIGYAQEPTSTADQLFQQTSLIVPAKFDELRLVWVVKKEK